MQALSVGGNRFVWVDGALTTQVGTEEEPSEAVTTVTGTHTTSATDRMRFTSEKEIVLECGDSRVVIGPEEVRIEAKKLLFVAKESAVVKSDGPTVELTDHVEVSAGELKLYSKGASLELASSADLNGAQVNLNCGGGAAKLLDVANGPARKLRPFTTRQLDDDLKPFANKKYRLVVDGLVFDGTTDEQGGLTEKVPAEATVGQLTLWIEEYPSGTRLRRPIAFSEAPIPPPATVEGALVRLKQLGYYEGELVAELTPDARAAIQYFQADNALEPSGELDQATAAKVNELYTA
jgi:type VI secretion system secreted protein VgrG